METEKMSNTVIMEKDLQDTLGIGRSGVEHIMEGKRGIKVVDSFPCTLKKIKDFNVGLDRFLYSRGMGTGKSQFNRFGILYRKKAVTA
jgi:hypothetical protein